MCALALSAQAHEAYLFSYFSNNAHEGRSGQSAGLHLAYSYDGLKWTSLFLLPLGLPANDSFWACPDEPWTSVKAWSGESFPKDHKWPINPQPLYWE